MNGLNSNMFVMSAAAVALAAAPALAQEGKPSYQKDKQAQRSGEMVTGAAPHFMASGDILGKDIANPNEEDIGELQDLIVNVPGGKIMYAVLDTGVIGKKVAVPYGALAWNSTEDQFIVHVTEEQLEIIPAFDPNRMSNLYQESWLSTLRGIFGDVPELKESPAHAEHDPFMVYFKKDQPHKVKGTIIAVERQSPQEMTDQFVFLNLRGDDNQTHRVILGPTWYVTEQGYAPTQGQNVELDVVRARDAQGTLLVASQVSGDDARLQLRERSGEPVWQSSQGSKGAKGAKRAQYMLLSDLDDGDVTATGNEDFGSIDEVFVEVHSGTAAFASISEGGVLGIGDTEYVLPFTALQFDAQNNARIDLSKAALKGAPTLDDAEQLNNPAFRQRVYTHCKVQPVKFDTARAQQWPKAQRTSGTWSERPGQGDPLQAQFRSGKPVTIEGQVASKDQRSPMRNAPETVMVTIRTDSATEEVILGPASFMEKQNVTCERGDRVQVTGRRVTLEGRPMIIATDVSIDGQRLQLRDSSGNPKWEMSRQR